MDILFMILLGLLAVILALIVYFIIDIIRYKHHFRVRKLTNNRVIIFDIKARVAKDRDGIDIWFIKGKGFKQKLPIPEPDAIEINSKGQFCVEAYYTEEGSFVFLKNTELDNAKKGVLEGFEPLTTSQRSFMVDQQKKAQADKGFDWKQHIPTIASFAVLIIIFVLALSFWGDVMQPVLDFANTQADIAEQQANTMSKLQEIIQDKQTIGGTTPSTQAPN